MSNWKKIHKIFLIIYTFFINIICNWKKYIKSSKKHSPKAIIFFPRKCIFIEIDCFSNIFICTLKKNNVSKIDERRSWLTVRKTRLGSFIWTKRENMQGMINLMITPALFIWYYIECSRLNSRDFMKFHFMRSICPQNFVLIKGLFLHYSE